MIDPMRRRILALAPIVGPQGLAAAAAPAIGIGANPPQAAGPAMGSIGETPSAIDVADHGVTNVASAQENVTKNPFALSDGGRHAEGGYTKITQDWGTPRGITDPLTRLPVRDARGEILRWPSGINPIEVYNSGLNSKSSEALAAGPVLFSQNAYWDFQRGGSQDGKINHPEFVDASTVVIGLYNAAAGVPLSVRA
ncbi:hypothetical protein U1839_02435 [Sphingomonas sp. RT2P30]|uniref:hypothetical protein n=1 Tax=Parasphingomonas halimpatiens TaxID=3096162 RepID=UPI002FC80F8E